MQGNSRGEGVEFVFLKIKEKPEGLMVLINELLNCYFIAPFSKNSHQFLGVDD